MTTFESQPTSIHKSAEEVYTLFSDLTNIEKFKDKLPSDKVQDLEYTSETCTFSVSPIGKVGFQVVERVPFEKVAFSANGVPIGLSLQIDLQQQGENETLCKVTANADLNPFIKPMVSKPIQEAVDKIAETLAFIFK